MKRLGWLLAAVLLVGCSAPLDVSGTGWQRVGTDIGQVTRDQMACVRGASDAGETRESYVGGVADAVRHAVRERARLRAYDRCMQERGYRRAA